MYYLLCEILYKDGSTEWVRDEAETAHELLKKVASEYDGLMGEQIVSCFSMITKDRPVLNIK